MRLRYFAVDYFNEASRSSREESLKHYFSLPEVSSLEDRFNSLKELHDIYHQNLLNGTRPKISYELPLDFSWVDKANSYDKILAEIFPAQLDQPSIDLGVPLADLSELIHPHCFGDHCELRIRRKEGLICSKSQKSDNRENSSKCNASDVVHEAPVCWCCGRSSFGTTQVKEQKPESTFSKILEIEPPTLGLPVLWKCFPEDVSLRQHWSNILSELGGPALRPVETEALFEANVSQNWVDISPPCCLPEPEHHHIYSSAVESRLSDIPELRYVLETCDYQQYPDKMDELMAKFMPVEILEIGEARNFNPVGPKKEITFPVMPTCLLRRFESQESNVEKETGNLVMGDLKTDMNLEHRVVSKLVYSDEFHQQGMLLSDLFCDNFRPEPHFTSSIQPKDFAAGSYYPFCNPDLTFEIPGTYDWSFCFSASLNPGVIAANTSQRPVKDLPGLHPSECFESLVVMPELRLDDYHFQSFPVPMLIYRQDEVLDEALGRLISFDCEPSTVPATDLLYLDWHLSDGIKCTNATCFSLQAQLTKKDECRPLPCTFLTTNSEVVTSRKYSQIAFRQLEDDEFHQDPYLNPFATETKGDKVESLPCSPLRQLSETQARQHCQGGTLAHKSQGKGQCTLFLNSQSDVNSIAANASLPSSPSSNFSQNQCTLDVKGGKLHLKVPDRNFVTDPVSGQNLRLPSRQPVRRFRIPRSDSPIALKVEAEDLHLKVGEGNCFNDPASRRNPQLQNRQPLKRFSPVRLDSMPNGCESRCSDLDFFIQARKGIPINRDNKDTFENSRNGSDVMIDLPNVSKSWVRNHASDSEQPATCEHKIELSVEIRKCVVSLASNYYTLLDSEEILGLTIIGDLKFPKEFGFDADGNSHLTSLISKVTIEAASHQKQILLRSLTALHVLRHTALNLCNYGIQVAHLYLESFLERMSFLEGYIMNSRMDLEEAYNQVESGVLEDHPKLSYIDKLLRPLAMERHRDKLSPTRILLLADRRAFFTLVKKLVSLGLTPYQIDRKEKYLHNGVLQDNNIDNLRKEILEALTFSDCLLVSYMYINPAFPVEGFTMILQYADPPSMKTTDSAWTEGRCEKHFFKLLLHSEDFQMKSSIDTSQRQEHGCQDPQEQKISGIIQPLKPNPTKEGSVSMSSSPNQTLFPTGHGLPIISSSRYAKDQPVEDNCSSDGRCDMIIVANISLPSEHLLAGRRSSYQKILHLEKENLQIIERELRLPVDLILSPATCVVIYTLRKLNLEPQDLKSKQNAFQDEIATHLKAISFSFHDCIMIFEGPTEFTSAALDIFAQLYALAATFEMQFQCFASRHMEVTDRIIMKSIEAVRRSKQMPSYPIMTEGPTLAEVFLTAFPSINPLTAHAILSSGWSLPAFISLTHAQQFAAVDKYDVPQHCLDLFKAECTYKAVPTIAILDCEAVDGQTNQPDKESLCLHGEHQPGLSAYISNHRPTPEVWKCFPVFPPASEVSNDRSEYNVGANQTSTSFPDFPPASEVSGTQVEGPEESDPFSTDLYGLLGIFKHSPDSEVSGIHMISSPLKTSHTNDEFSCLDVTQKYHGAQDIFKHPQELSKVDSMHWPSKSSEAEDDCAQRRGATDVYEVRNLLQLYEPMRAAYYGAQGSHNQSCGGERIPWPPDTSAPVDESKSSSRARETLYGEHEILLGSAEVLSGQEEAGPMEEYGYFDVERGVGSNFSFTSPAICSGGQGFGLNNALGSWNDHKRVRGGISGRFMDETLDLIDINGGFASELPSSSVRFDEFSVPRKECTEATAAPHEHKSSRFGQSTRRQPTLEPSSLDRFRYQFRSPSTETASHSRLQTKINFPRTAPPSRTQSANLTNRRPATTRKPAAVIKILGEAAFDKRAKKTLGYARRGTDTQQRLVWRNNAPLPSSKRQKIDATRTR